jgi:hypothetical protein
MGFNVEITFTGLCIFVPSSVPGPVKLCVVLQNANYDKRYALDGSWLKPHTGFVSFNLKDLSGGSQIPSQASVLAFLKGHRLTLDARGGEVEDGQFLTTVPNLDVITGGRGGVNPAALSSNASADEVAGQVIIKRGILKAGDPIDHWVIPSTLDGPGPQPEGLSYEVILTLRGVDSFTILAQKFGTTDPEPWNFSVASGETLKIKVGNLCGVTACRCTEPGRVPDPDEDFKWHYELLEKKECLADILKSALPLPIPMPVKDPPAGQGINCIPALAAPADINTLLNQTVTAGVGAGSGMCREET